MSTREKEISAILEILIHQSPILLVCVAGLIVALKFRHKAPAASLWVGIAFCLGLFTCGEIIYYALSGSRFIVILTPILVAASYLLLLIAVYVQRTNVEKGSETAAEPLWQPLINITRSRPGLKSVFFTSFTIVFLLVAGGSAIISLVTPESFCGTTRIRLLNDTDATGTNTPPAPSVVFDRHVLETECEIMQSPAILGMVVESLDLNRAWGKKYAVDGEPLKTTESIALLKGRLLVSSSSNTGIIEIRVYDERAVEAAKVANAVATAYQAYRLGRREGISQARIRSFVKQIEAGREEMQLAEANVEKASKEFNIPKEDGSLLKESEPGLDKLRPYFEAKQKLKELQSRNQNLLNQIGSERDKSKIPGTGPVEVVESASPGLRPVRPKTAADIGFGIWLGLWLGLASGVAVVWIAIKVENKRKNYEATKGEAQHETLSRF